MSDTAPSTSKRAIYVHFAAVAKAIGSPHRMELLELLAQGERPVEELVELTGLSVANTSQHLQQLRRVGLATNRRDGKNVFYRLADPTVVTLLGALQQIAGRNSAAAARAIDRFFRQRDTMEPVSRAELSHRMSEGGVVVLDVRPEREFAAGHIRGALNIPVTDLKRHLAKLPRRKEIVAYCRGPYCVMAFDAVALLRERGFKVRRLDEGYPEWKLAGLPVQAA